MSRLTRSVKEGSPHEYTEVSAELEMTILGTSHRVTVIPESPYDPENLRLRA